METLSDKVRIFIRTVGVGHRLSVIKLVMKADLPSYVQSWCFHVDLWSMLLCHTGPCSSNDWIDLCTCTNWISTVQWSSIVFHAISLAERRKERVSQNVCVQVQWPVKTPQSFEMCCLPPNLWQTWRALLTIELGHKLESFIIQVPPKKLMNVWAAQQIDRGIVSAISSDACLEASTAGTLLTVAPLIADLLMLQAKKHCYTVFMAGRLQNWWCLKIDLQTPQSCILWSIFVGYMLGGCS